MKLSEEVKHDIRVYLGVWRNQCLWEIEDAKWVVARVKAGGAKLPHGADALNLQPAYAADVGPNYAENLGRIPWLERVRLYMIDSYRSQIPAILEGRPKREWKDEFIRLMDQRARANA